MQFARIWRRAKWIGRGVLFFTPLTSFYMMQFVFGSMPWDHSLGVTLANYICIGAAFFLLTALTNRLLLCSLIVHLACIAWGRCQLLCQPLPGPAHPPLGFHSPAHCGGCGRQL